eukprot:1542858-Pyramimonas_sp.AAC.2
MSSPLARLHMSYVLRSGACYCPPVGNKNTVVVGIHRKDSSEENFGACPVLTEVLYMYISLAKFAVGIQPDILQPERS